MWGRRAVVLLMATASCAAQTLSYQPAWNLFSPEQDIEIGQQAEARVLRELPVLHNPTAEAFISQLGARLGSQVPGPRFRFNFSIVDEKAVNAIALPGGPIFVNLGTICAAASEAQLAGLIAHEESHVELRHSTAMVSKEEAQSVPLGTLGGTFGTSVGGLGRLGAAMVASGEFLGYSRAMEKEADAFGTGLMNAAGYDPREMARFFASLDAQGGVSSMQFLSDHPDPGNRRAAISAELAKLGNRSPYREDSPAFNQMQDLICTGSVPRLAPPQQFSFEGTALTPPREWSVYGAQTSLLTLAPADGFGGEDEDNLVRGTIMSIFQGTEGKLIENLHRANPRLHEVAHSRGTIRVEGVSGTTALFTNVNAFNVQETDRLVIVPRPNGQLLYLICIAPTSEFGRYSVVFDQLVASMKLQ